MSCIKEYTAFGKENQKQYLSITKPSVLKSQALCSWCSLLHATGLILTIFL